ncbi:Bax inhibitor 1 like-domain-containing protein [Dunaliella salina]|uniref:Bax inhibitor 1 like-domain-containing protein n=1 Tax=Dunaliella salina TaxID=3046 RepID=A0ABQ7FY57_DUNSA|nr:Bax inhibitor 1 like-domain-containing protein [Dunaliella salina]|eukprot:KAF5827301.1 Bax inhibitor 1 like-domain-containing protein [Dunaliella salina]
MAAVIPGASKMPLLKNTGGQLCTLHTSSPRGALRASLPIGPPFKCEFQTGRPPRFVHANALQTSTTNNPAFTYGKVEESMLETGGRRSTDIMTVDGAVQKTALLLGVSVLGAAYSWMQIFGGTAASAMAALGACKIAGIVGFASSLATMFKPHWAPVTGIVFSGAQGLAIGGLASILELRFPGIALNAAALVFGTASTLLACYQARIISVTDQFRNGVMCVTGGYIFCLLFGWLLSLLGVKLPGLLTGGVVGMGITLVATALAAANLLLDFDMIKQTARQRMPKWFESYAAFSLMVTLVWFYTQALRLLSMLAGGRDD